MKKTILAMAVAGLTLLSAAAQANVITIDDFNSGDQVLVLSAANNSMSNTNSIRTLSTKLLASELSVESAARVEMGALQISNGPGEDSEVTVKWNILPNLLPAGATNARFLFTIIGSDGNPTNFDFTLGGAPLLSNSIAPNTQNMNVPFDVSASLFNAGGELTLVLNGDTGWDLAVDFFGVEYDLPTTTVPEPASMALVGLGLLGLGAAGRRRKS